jgi:hypothetical protein
MLKLKVFVMKTKKELLEAGAIWPEGFQAPNSLNEKIAELVRKHEQLLAFIVFQMGQCMDQNVKDLLGYLCGKYTQLEFPESIEATTFRHVDTRAAFAKLDTKS